MMATNLAILIREKIQVKIVRLILYDRKHAPVDLLVNTMQNHVRTKTRGIVHNVDLNSLSPRSPIKFYGFWYEHDQGGFPPSFRPQIFVEYTDANIPNRSRKFDEDWSTQAGLDTVSVATVIAQECRKWGVFTLEHNGPAVPSWNWYTLPRDCTY